MSRWKAGELYENRMIRSKITEHTTTQNYRKRERKKAYQNRRQNTESKTTGFSSRKLVNNLRLENRSLESHNMTLNMATVHFILVHLRLSKCHLRSVIKQNSTILHRLSEGV